MTRFATLLSCVFGYLFVGLALLIGIETFGRKLLGFSLQGTDELSGYVLAVASSLAFAVAVVAKTHIRIDLIYTRLPQKFQIMLNWLSTVGVALTAFLMLWSAWYLLVDTMEYGSTAPTPWATPLIYPQAAWFAGLATFALVAAVLAIRATIALLRGDMATMMREFVPPSTSQDVAEELEDLERRQARDQDKGETL